MRTRSFIGKHIDMEALARYHPEFWSVDDKHDRNEEEECQETSAAKKDSGSLNAQYPDEITIDLSTDLYDREDLCNYWDFVFQIRIYHRRGTIVRVERLKDFHMCGGQGAAYPIREYPARVLELEADAIMADIVKA